MRRKAYLSGHQVLDIAALVVSSQTLPDTLASAILTGAPMAQARIESELPEAMRHLDPEREVFAAEGQPDCCRPNNLILPPALCVAFNRS